VRTISIPALRSLVVSAQRYASRTRRADSNEVEAAIKRASCIQLDSISTVERSHRVAVAARVGDYPAGTVAQLLSRGRIIEYWAHEACLLPADDWPLFGWVRENYRTNHPWRGDVRARFPGLASRCSPRSTSGARSRHATSTGRAERTRCGGGSQRRRYWKRSSAQASWFVRKPRALDGAFDRALDRLRRTIGLQRVVR
jgi:uncharacterized protein YcaQ